MMKFILFLLLTLNVYGDFCDKCITVENKTTRSTIITLEKNRSTTMTFRLIHENGKYYMEFVAFKLDKCVDSNTELILQFDDESIDRYSNMLFNCNGISRFEVPVEMGSNLTTKLLVGVELKYRKYSMTSNPNNIKSNIIRQIVNCIWIEN